MLPGAEGYPPRDAAARTRERVDIDSTQRLRRNALLSELPDRDLATVAASGRLIPAQGGELLQEQDQRVERALFPLTGVLGLLKLPPVDEPGGAEPREVGVAVVGPDGVVAPVPVGSARPSSTQVRCLVAGELLEVPLAALRSATGGGTALRSSVERGVGEVGEQTAQHAACAVWHTPAQRAAHWLLLLGPGLPAGAGLAAEALARLLGLDRQDLDAVLDRLRPGAQVAGGEVVVADRHALDEAACGCLAPLHRAVQAVRSAARDADAGAPAVAVLPRPAGVGADEVQWLRRLASGTTVATLADALGRGLPEMYRALSTTYAKLGATNRTEAVLYAARWGLLDDGPSGEAAGAAARAADASA